MSEIALAKINSFAHVAQQVEVSPEEPIFVLTGSQLQEIIAQAVQDATEPLKTQIQAINNSLKVDYQDIRDLYTAIDEMDTKINHKEPGKTEISRAEKIEKYLQARPDHRATFETLKGHLGINRILLNQALTVLMKAHPGDYAITRTPGDKRKHTVVMLPKLR